MGASDDAVNACAGPFGALYDLLIERPWLMRRVARLLWGIEISALYRSMDRIEQADGVTILDVPCGGGVAFRALRPDQDVRYIAVDLSARMLGRAERRAKRRGLGQVEFLAADIRELPLADGEADLVVCYSGLHMLVDPQRAVAEVARCLRPGGWLVGTSFFSDVGTRARILFEIGSRAGHPTPPDRADLHAWLKGAGFADQTIGPQSGFAAFSARRAPG